MSALPNWSTVWGTELTPADYESLAKRWITKEGADEAGFRRGDSVTGQQMFGRKRGDCSGILLPNTAPWNPDVVREFRLRLF